MRSDSPPAWMATVNTERIIIESGYKMAKKIARVEVIEEGVE